MPLVCALQLLLQRLPVLALSMLLSSLSWASASAYQVSVQLQWKHQFEFAGFYAAQAQGYYRQAGLSVNLVEYDADRSVLDEVIQGRRTFGVTSSELILARLQGAPVVMLANYFKHSPLVIVAHPRIQSPADLRGKSLMISTLDFNNTSVRRMFKSAGVGVDTLNVVPNSFDINDFISGNVDAFAAYSTNELFQLREKQVPFTLLDPNAYSTVGSKSFFFLAHKDAPELVSMLNKALTSLTAVDIDRLERRWFGVDEALEADQRTVEFTSAEENYITQKSVIKMCVDPDWMPFESINELGLHEGMSAELLRLAGTRAGLSLTLVKTRSWNESLELAKARRCDIRDETITDVKIIGKLDDTWELAVATRNDEPLLRDIMQKAIGSLTLQEKLDAKSRWFSIRVEQGVDYLLLWKILAAVAVFLFGIIFWNRRLAKFSQVIQAKNVLIEKQHTQVASALQQVATLLDNSGQGFLSFSKNLRIDNAYSRECQRIFQCEILGRTIVSLLSPDDVERQRFLKKTLNLVMTHAEDTLRRDALLGLLPKLYHFAERYYNAEYKLVSADKMMLILTDVTDEVRLRERLAEERKRLEFIVNAMENRNELLDLLREYQDFRTRILPDLLVEETQGNVLRSEIGRRIHTFKSLFAQARLSTIPQTLHALESQLNQLRDKGDACTPGDIKQVLGRFDLGEGLEQDLALLREKLGEHYFIQDKAVRVAESTLDQLERELTSIEGCSHLTACLESRQHALTLIVRLRFVPLRSLLESHFRAAELLAQRLGKPLATIVYEGESLLVDPKLFGGYCRSLVHVFRNAVDHGIEDADTRVLMDKPEVGHIRCHVHHDAVCLRLVIEDDGGGLDAEAIRAGAIEHGLVLPENAMQLSEEDTYAQIFIDGFSTRAQVSDISGRGLGLNAVHAELKKLHGNVTVQSAPGQGTRFIFEIPNQHVTVLHAHTEQRERDRAGAFLAPFHKVAQSFCEKNLQLTLTVDPLPQLLAQQNLLDFTALIPLGGLNVSLGISLERSLLLTLTRRFDPAFAESDIESLADSVGAEIANTLIGNATVYFTPMARQVTLGLPVTEDVVAHFDKPDYCPAYCLKGIIENHPFYLFCLFTREDTP